jgi:predicted transcriptional regulator
MSELRDRILAKLDILKLYESIGVRIAKGARPDRNGWLSCHSFYREDVNPSAAINIGTDLKWRGIYIDHGEAGYNGKPRLAKGIFDMLAQHGPYMDGREAFFRLGREVGEITGEKGDGISGRKKPKDVPPPTLDDVARFRKNLTPEVIQYLKDKRGLTDESIAKYEIGWDPGRERNTLPVYEPAPIGKRLVNIRLHNSKKAPKTLNWPGYGEARLYGLERLAAALPGSTAIITEGEWDSLLAEQESGYIGVTSTNGAKAFKPEWVKHFHGHHVVVLYDCDAEGRDAVFRLILPYFKAAIEAGQVLSLKVIWLYTGDPDKAHKDITDWIVKDGGSGEALKKLIADTPPYIYPTSKAHLEDPVVLSSFVKVDQSEHAGQRVTVDLQVFGENTVAYHAPVKVQVVHCIARKEGKCTGPDHGRWLCVDEINIPLGERILIASVGATASQLKTYLRDYICDKDKRPTLTVADADQLTVRELWAHQVFNPMQSAREDGQIEKPIYVIGGELVGLGKYRATGRIVTTYSRHFPTLLVDTLERLEEDYQAFDLDRARPHLLKLKEMFAEEIVEDISYHVTRIYRREALHLGVLLVLCSADEINLPGEGAIRGWLSSILIGDTGTGKTSICQGICEFAGVGDRVSGMTSSRTGITYGIEQDYRKGWRVKAGALLKMNRQALIVDEAQDVEQGDIKTLAEGIETGITKIDRIAQRTFECRTRVILSCNPRHPRIPTEQLTLGSFDHGALALDGLFPSMLIRRVDLCLFASQDDIEDKEAIFNAPQDLSPQRVAAADLRALIFFAWSLKREQIVISSAVGQEIRNVSLELSRKFGCGKPPIVYPEDFRKTFTRLCVAYAILDLSTNDDFTQVIIKPGHVHDMAGFVEEIYAAENCRLEKVAEEYRRQFGMADENEIKALFAKLLQEGPTRDRLLLLLGQLLTGEWFKQADLAKSLQVNRITVNRDLKTFRDFGLVTVSQRFGCKRSAKFARFMVRLEQDDPELFRSVKEAVRKVERKYEDEE